MTDNQNVTVSDELPEETPEPITGSGDQKGSRKGILKYIPIPSIVFFGFFAVALAVHLISFASEGFANFYNEKIGAIFRMALAKLTGWIPFSLAETVVILIPAIVVVIFIWFVRVGLKKNGARCVVALFSVVTMFYSMFVLTLGTGYQNSPLDKKLGIERKLVSAQELYDTAIKVNDGLAEVIDGIYFPSGGGSSVMPYDLDEMIDKLNSAYDTLREECAFIPRLHAPVKYIALSKPMTYTHLSGVYCYYTGEANININFPDYTIAYTAAHEMAHQRGIAPEDEANFVAFLACVSSDDPYIRYSGYQNMLEYLMNALYSADRELYSQLTAKVEPRAMTEIYAYNKFFEPYRKSTASAVSSAINDTYLKALGESAGEKSYGMVVDLAVAYYRASE